MKLWHISDTHGYHERLTIPTDVDILIHSGDAANTRNIFENTGEIFLFLEWLGQIKKSFKHIVFVPGNHDTWIEKNEKKARLICEKEGINLLINQAIELEGIKFWGSPLTPEFGCDWAYNRDRGKIGKTWNNIPLDTEILITHGPPKGVLDVSQNRQREYELTGCSALASRIESLKSLKLNAFGHIHDGPDGRWRNQGIVIRDKVVYSNAACVTDGKDSLHYTSYGNYFTWNKGKIQPII